jgi:uncharacterized membrane protein
MRCRRLTKEGIAGMPRTLKLALAMIAAVPLIHLAACLAMLGADACTKSVTDLKELR